MNSKLGPGRPIKSQSKVIIANVNSFFEKEKTGKFITPLAQVTKRTSAATGVGLTTVKAICRSAKAAADEGKEYNEETPGKTRSKQSLICNMDSFALEGIRRRIHQFYLKGKLPTLSKLLTSLKSDEEPLFQGGRDSLRVLLKNKLGFKYGKVDHRNHLLEKPDVVTLRHDYLRQLRSIDLKKNVYFLDETWINEHHCVSFCWQSDSFSGLKVPTGKGRRLIVLHAGSSEGFVSGGLLLFTSKSGLDDYHRDMNALVFTKWFEEQFLPNIKSNSIIIMDNASYHSEQIEKAPTSSNKKQDLKDWLSENSIPFSNEMLKPELYQLVKLHKPQKKRYVIDELARNSGHKIIRLPPYHCQFNPIELIWAQVKHKVAVANNSYKLSDIEVLTTQAVKDTPPENWLSAIKHVEKIMQEYWEKDHLIDMQLDNFVIHINSGSDTETDSEDETDGIPRNDNDFDVLQSGFKIIDYTSE